MFSFLQLNLYLCLILLLKVETEGITSGNIIYDELNAGKRMKGGKGVKTFKQRTKLSCALSCSRDESCYSFTFCGQKVCYLNSENVPNEMSLVDAPSCQMYFNKKDDRGISKFNQTLETISAPITQSPNTFCFPSSKDNGLKCIESNNFEQWYWVSASERIWEAAKDICEGKNGVLLFSKTWSLRDSFHTFMDLLDSLGYKTDIWVGIREESGDWVDVNGGLQSNITLGSEKDNTHPRYCLRAKDFELSPRSCDREHSFICELNSPVQ